MDDTSARATADALRVALSLYDTGVEIMRQNLRRQQPDASDDSIERQLSAWIRERPGAPFGDSAGRPVTLARRRT